VRSENVAWLIPCLIATLTRAQDLAPRAYIITPTGSNAVTVAHSWNQGDITFDPSVPIEDAKGEFQTSVLSYYHSYTFLGRSSNIVLSVPYATGTFSGVVNGVEASVNPSGLADARIRVSMNLRGGPAMRAREFLGWKEKRLIGVSLTAVIPSGQNDRARLVNIGTNRWAFKPEIALTRKWQRVVVEGYTGMWLFTSNSNFYPGYAKRTQDPIVAFEAHAGYYIKPRLWASFDGNFWIGGRSSINGVKKQDQHRDSRVGVTVSVPLGRRQSLKFSHSRGAVTRVGGSFQTFSTGWQYSWIGKSN
jgi:hypothetical protein